MQRVKQVTGKDIAAAVGVSRQAVSAVLSGSNPNCVSAAVREKILAEASRVGYRPNTAALRLAGHKTRQIGLLLGGYGFALGYPTVLAGKIRQQGYHPVLMIANNIEEADDAAAELRSGAYDGIFIGTGSSWQHRDFQVPVVIQEYGDCDLCMDLEAAGAMAAEHMLAQGYEKLVFVSMVPYSSADKKFAGITRIAGPQVKHIVAGCEADPGRALLTEMDVQQRVGFICSDDILAVRIINFLREKSIAVPRRAGVIGYGGYHYGSLVHPALSTLVFPVDELATAAADLLINKVKNNICGWSGKTLTFAPQLKINGSTSEDALPDNFSDLIKDICNINYDKKKE